MKRHTHYGRDSWKPRQKEYLVVVGLLAAVALRCDALLRCCGNAAAFQQSPPGQLPIFGGAKGSTATGSSCLGRLYSAAGLCCRPVPLHLASCRQRVFQQEPCRCHKTSVPLVSNHTTHLRRAPACSAVKLCSDSFAVVAVCGVFEANVPCACAASQMDVVTPLTQDIDRVFFWQPLIGSALFITTITGIQGRATRAAELRQEWATRETQLRQLQASELAEGQPMDKGQETALVAELERLNQEELATRSVFGFMLPRGKAPAAIRMTERHGSGMAEPLMDQQQESLALVIIITLLTGVLFYISG